MREESRGDTLGLYVTASEQDMPGRHGVSKHCWGPCRLLMVAFVSKLADRTDQIQEGTRQSFPPLSLPLSLYPLSRGVSC